MRGKSQRTGLSTSYKPLNADTRTKVCGESFHPSNPDKSKLKKISSPSENKNYATAQPGSTKAMKHSIDNGLQGQMTRTTGYNKQIGNRAGEVLLSGFSRIIGTRRAKLKISNSIQPP